MFAVRCMDNIKFPAFSVEKSNAFGNIKGHNHKRGIMQMFYFPKKQLNLVFAITFAFISAQVQGKVYYLNTSEAGDSYGCWNDSSKWSETYERTVNGEGKNVWTFSGENPSEFTAADDFVVPALSTGYTLRDAGGTGKIIEWNGKSLQLGGTRHGTSYVAVLRLITRGAGSYLKFNNDGLVLGGQARIQPHSSSQPYNIKGTVTVTAEEEKYPAFIQQTTSARNISLNFLDKFKGAASVYAAIKSATNDFTVSFADTTEYYGTLTATNIYEDALLTVDLSSDFPGTLSISTNVTLVPASGVKIANLKCFDGAIIDVRSGTLEITGSIVKSGKIRVLANNFGEDATNPRFSELLKFPAAAGIAVEDFEFVGADGQPLDCDGYSMTTDSDGKNSTIAAVRYGDVKLLSADDGKYSGDYASSMTNAANWSDGLWPTNPLVDYVANYNLRTCDSSADWTNPTDDFVFRGRSLAIDGASKRFLVCNRSFRCDNLIFRNGAQFYKRRYSGIEEDGYHNLAIYGTLTVENQKSLFYVGYYETLTLDCSLKGSGTVCMTSHSGGSTEASRGIFSITGSNPEFLGEMVVTIQYNMPADPIAEYKRVTPSFDRNYTTLNLADKGNLGGKLPAVNPKAFTIENMSQVKPAVGITSLTLDEPTRGIFIKWVGRLMANEGQTFTVKSPLAVHGTLWKEGEGTLVLGNPAPTFGENADSDMPDVDATNRTFRVAGGDVEIASADAVNGLDVVFTNGAGRIVLDLDSEDATFRTFGLRNTKSATPFAVEGDVAKIPVVLDFDVPPETGSSRGLVTVASADGNPAALVSSLSFVKSPALNGLTVSREWVGNGDGTFTLKATFKDVGTRIVIR